MRKALSPLSRSSRKPPSTAGGFDRTRRSQSECPHSPQSPCWVAQACRRLASSRSLPEARRRTGGAWRPCPDTMNQCDLSTGRIAPSVVTIQEDIATLPLSERRPPPAPQEVGRLPLELIGGRSWQRDQRERADSGQQRAPQCAQLGCRRTGLHVVRMIFCRRLKAPASPVWRGMARPGQAQRPLGANIPDEEHPVMRLRNAESGAIA